ncbi:MFS transporter [Cytobacillus dafuensis]|uniref:MFS transporter n=1 Tax=Cytobacillus dafuensis TaxID=1742359 RepID=A0A5B8Z1B6_CYTDA|nr:MFS transporter [Cytobacillus dafuensis]QED46547.1 MFS transporter [Cytobacillus dafuensis]
MYSSILAKLDQARLNRNHFKMIFAAVLGDMLEFFDYFIMGFVLAFIIVPWKLNYLESSIILLSAGIGAMLGSFVFGMLADRFGRRNIMIITILTFSLASGAMYFTPEGWWGYLTLFRFIVGFGVGGLYSVSLTLIQEVVPSRYRGRISGIVTAFIPIGSLMGSLSAGYLSDIVGWRGLFLLTLLPALLVIFIRISWVPESPRWLLSRGKYDEAIKTVSRFTYLDEQDKKTLHNSKPISLKTKSKTRFLDVFKYPRSLIVSWGVNLGSQTAYYGIGLWGPAILALVLKLSPTEAAKMYIFVSLGGFVGRWFFSFISEWLGRKATGFITCVAGGILTILAGIFHSSFIGGTSVMWLLLIATYFFIDGAFTIVGPYSSEVWPSHIRATGMGSAYGFGGLGKIIGPLGLALIAGATNVVSPKATIDAVVPAFIFLGSLVIIGGILFLFGHETNKRSIEEIDAMVMKGKGQKEPAAVTESSF